MKSINEVIKKTILAYGLLAPFIHFAQIQTGNDWGVQVGISTQFGTHINQLGLKLQGYYIANFVQLNAGGLFHLTGKDLGGRTQFYSSRFNAGAVFMGGKRTAIPTFILDGLNHQSDYQYGIGYTYLWYIDNVKSSQRSGGMAVHVEQWSVVIENDFYAGQGKDRFRTSHAHINYHEEWLNLSFHAHLWTGETNGVRRMKDESYPTEYKNLVSTPFGKTSHGILHVSADVLTAYGNAIGIDLGVDHERIRHVIQNKMMHDKKFIPASIRKTNPHYPMLDHSGEPILDNNTPPPSPSLFLQLGLNRGYSY
jgi:hypothetical protein